VKTDDNPKLKIVEEHLRSLTDMVFVTDQRTIKSTSGVFDENRPDAPQIHIWGDLTGRLGRVGADHDAKSIDMERIVAEALVGVLKKTSEFMVSKAMSSSSLGERGANQVYLDISKAIVRSVDMKSVDPEQARVSLLKSVKYVSEQVSRYEKYRILGKFDLSPIALELQNASPAVVAQLISVLEPYIKSLDQRLEANKSLLNLMSSFEVMVNKYLRRKEMVVRLVDGISFRDGDGLPLEVDSLSSGERHLIFLACAAILSRDEPTVILIDEPELSLNYKWQRDLLPGLVSLAGPDTQFIVATHSFEIISGARKALVSLEPSHSVTDSNDN
jgi:alkylhydroperoxidase/carboxymuconolactone decarboxylase family protein YurZ